MDMAYNEPVPMAYKVRLSEYFNAELTDSQVGSAEAEVLPESAVSDAL
jgi:hypothetical protein